MADLHPFLETYLSEILKKPHDCFYSKKAKTLPIKARVSI